MEGEQPQVENPVADLQHGPASTSTGDAGSMPEKESAPSVPLPDALALVGIGSRLVPMGKLSAAAKAVQWFLWFSAAAFPAVMTHMVTTDQSPMSAGGGALLVLHYGPALLWVSFPFAFCNLCHVTRPGGPLAKLLGRDGGNQAAVRVRPSVVKNLAAWRLRLRVLVVFFALILMIVVGFFSRFAFDALVAVATTLALFSALVGVVTTCAWVFSLRVAAAVAMVRTSSLAERLEELSSDLSENVSAFDARQWANEIELPAQSLALHTLPLLSSWGSTVALVGAGYAGVAAALLLFLVEAKATALPVPAVIGLYSFVLGIGFIPVIIADAPAKVSTVSAKMIETLNTIRLRNLGLFAEITPIHDALNMLNNGQGIGFLIGGTVINRRRLWTGMTSIWSSALTVLPMLSGDDGCPKSDLPSTLHECDYVGDYTTKSFPKRVESQQLTGLSTRLVTCVRSE
eukprot:SAG31_NODE_5131_length_2724_cov_1.385143_1_plen_458_part_00